MAVVVVVLIVMYVNHTSFVFRVLDFGDTIPEQFSCEGGHEVPVNISYKGLPTGTQSIAWIMEDPDAYHVTGTIYTHSVVYNVFPGEVGSGTFGLNESKEAKWFGPCPPPGETHLYNVIGYALDKVLTFSAPPTKDELREAMNGHILASTVQYSRYTRPATSALSESVTGMTRKTGKKDGRTACDHC